MAFGDGPIALVRTFFSYQLKGERFWRIVAPQVIILSRSLGSHYAASGEN